MSAAASAPGHTHTVGALRWYSQTWPAARHAPVALLLHGTGASAHSMEQLGALMSPHYRVIAPDLPAHARTETPIGQALDLPSVAQATAQWLASLGLRPELIVGHSAGAAIAVRMVLDGHATPRALWSLNGALWPLQGMAGQLFLPLARMMVVQPLVPHLFSSAASLPWVLQRLLASTGSHIGPEGAAAYAQLLASPRHVAGVLRLMASWDLTPLATDMPHLTTPLHLLVGLNDRTVNPTQAHNVKALVPSAVVHPLAGLGHLAHEEDANAVWRVMQGESGLV